MATKDDSASSRRTQGIRRTRPHSLTVLVVEDEWLLRWAICEHLIDAGFTVLEAESAEHASVILAATDGIDVVLTDIRLGGELNGWDVGIRAHSARPRIPVIYASGNPIEPRRDVPGSRFLSKPYRPTQVVETCRELAGQRQ